MFLSQSKPVARFRDKFFFNRNIQKEGLFTFIESTGYITITGYTGSSSNVEIPSQINSKNVRYIDANAFSSKTFIQQVTLPSTLYAIRASAFENCTGLRTINFPTSSLKTLYDNCFKGCTNLLTLTLPNSLTKVDTSAFENCTSLTSVKFGSGLETIGTSAFSGCVLLSSIGPATTTSVIQLKSIGASAFFGANLSSLNFDSVNFPFLKSIGTNAFASNSLLETVVLPTSIGVEATSTSQECYISSDAFLDCNLLRSYVIQPPTAILVYVKYLSAYPNLIFSYDIPSLSGTPLQVLYLFPPRAYGNTATSTLYTIPESVTKLGDNAFRRARNITKIVLPTSLQNIGANCFLNSNIKKIYTGATEPSNNIAIIPDTVSSVGKGAFKNCSFVEAQISSALGSIPQTCFANCVTLVKVVFKQLTPPSVASNAFSGVGSLALGFYPLGYSANWQNTFIPNLLLAEMPDPNAQLPYGLTYSVQGTNATITGYSGTSTTLVIPSVFIANGITLTVIGIGANAFKLQYQLSSITLPNTLTSIGEGAFSFSALASITIPNSVLSIGESMFYRCYSLRTATIGSGLLSIPPATFTDCLYLNSVTLPPSLTSIGASAFSGCSRLNSITIPNSVTSIGFRAFKDCSSLTGNFTLPNTLTIIEEGLFENSGINSITIPNIVTRIGASAFRNCRGLTGTFTIPDSVTHIDYVAFQGCSFITSFLIGKGVNNMGSFPFEDCISLSYISVDPENSVYCSEFGVLFNKEKNVLFLYPPKKIGSTYVVPSTVSYIWTTSFKSASNLTSIQISDSVIYIGDYAFFGSYNLITVTIGNGMQRIEQYAFTNCVKLQSFTFAQGCPITTIGDSCFYGCRELLSFTIPNSVTRIYRYTFAECSLLANLVIGSGVSEIGENFIANCFNLSSLVVPNNVLTIAEKAFLGTRIVNATLNVLSIPTYCFSGNIYLTTFNAPNALSIGKEAFNFCVALTTVNIPNVKVIREKAFYRCYGLPSIAFSEDINTIEASAFEDCTNLVQSGLNTGSEFPLLVSIGQRAYANTKLQQKLFIPKNCATLGRDILAKSLYCLGFRVSLENTKFSSRPGSFSNPSLRGFDDGCLYEPSGVVGEGPDFTALREVPIGDGTGSKKVLGDYVPQNQVKYIRTLAFAFFDISTFDSNQVISIDPQAFRGCGPTLEGFNVGPELTDLEPAHFLNMLEPSFNTYETVPELTSVIDDNSENPLKTGKLSEITVDSNNLYFSEDSGVLLNKNRTKLIAYPNGRPDVSYTIPNTVTTVAEGAFCRTPLELNLSGSQYYYGRRSSRYGFSSPIDAVMVNSTKAIGGPFADTQGHRPDLKQNHQYLRHLTVPGSIKGVGINTINVNGALTGFVPPRNLTSITLGEGVKTVDIFSFFDIPTLTLPASVDTILTHIEYSGTVPWESRTAPWSGTSTSTPAYNRYPRFGAPRTNFVVHSNNPNFSSEDGSLFTKNFSKLIRFNMQTNASTVTPGNVVTTIGKHAFAGLFLPAWDGASTSNFPGNSNGVLPKPQGAIRNIILGPNVNYVEDEAFIFTSLASLIFGQNVFTVGKNVYIYGEPQNGVVNNAQPYGQITLQTYDIESRAIIRFLSSGPPTFYYDNYVGTFSKLVYPWSWFGEANSYNTAYSFSFTPNATSLSGFYPQASYSNWSLTSARYLALESDV